MSALLAKAAIGIIGRLITENFLKRILVETLYAWAKTTDNELDDKVMQAMADTLDVDVGQLKK